MHSGLVVEQRLVDRTELLDAQIAIGDSFACCAAGRGARGQRQQRPPRRLVVQVAALGERRSRGREEPSVERRHAKITGTTARVREPRDRPQPVPETGGVPGVLGDRAERGDAVTVAIDTVPDWYEPACLGKQQEENSVDDGQGLLEGFGHGRCRPHERRKHIGRRRQHAVFERPADVGAMPVGFFDEQVQRCRQAMHHVPERRERLLLVRNRVQVELQVPAGIGTGCVYEAEIRSVEDRAPS
jgi:hypothetical protein